MREEATIRVTRRTVGHVAARIAELPFDGVAEMRKGKVTWKLRTALGVLFVGMTAGCKGLADVERLTANLGKGSRKLLGLWRRAPDTSMRDIVMGLGCRLDALRGVLHMQIRQADRRKQIVQDLPVRAVSMDGHVTATNLADAKDAPVKFAQQQGGKWMVRTITSCLATAVGRPVLDLHPVPPETNEMGVFVSALDALLRAYGKKLFDVVMYDAGACSLANATAVVERGLDYVFCLRSNQPELLAEAKRLLEKLGQNKALAMTTDLVGGKLVTRRLFLTTALAAGLDWTHLRTVLRVEATVEDKTTGELTIENRYYLSSMAHGRLSAADWLTLLRRRWAVENDCHNTWDKILREDTRPWLRAPAGMVVVMVLRRLAYNMLTLYRSVTTRSETKRARPWKELIEEIYLSLVRATVEMLAGMRSRPPALAEATATS